MRPQSWQASARNPLESYPNVIVGTTKARVYRPVAAKTLDIGPEGVSDDPNPGFNFSNNDTERDLAGEPGIEGPMTNDEAVHDALVGDLTGLESASKARSTDRARRPLECSTGQTLSNPKLVLFEPEEVLAVFLVGDRRERPGRCGLAWGQACNLALSKSDDRSRHRIGTLATNKR